MGRKERTPEEEELHRRKKQEKSARKAKERQPVPSSAASPAGQPVTGFEQSMPTASTPAKVLQKGSKADLKVSHLLARQQEDEEDWRARLKPRPGAKQLWAT